MYQDCIQKALMNLSVVLPSPPDMMQFSTKNDCGQVRKMSFGLFQPHPCQLPPILRMLLLATRSVGWGVCSIQFVAPLQKIMGDAMYVNSKLMSLISKGILLCPAGSSDSQWSRVGVLFTYNKSINACALFENVYKLGRINSVLKPANW